MQKCVSMSQELSERRGKAGQSLCIMGAQELRLNQTLNTSHVSYISLLPTELLEIIIVETVRASTGADDRSASCKPTSLCPHPRPELLLASVSQHWRAVTVGMALLWTEIHLFLGQSLDLLDLYLMRSQGQLLDIRFTGIHCNIRGRGSPASELEPEYLRMSNIILSHIHVCRRLEVHVDFSFPQLLDRIGHTKAPMLEELVVSYPPNIPNSRLLLFIEGLPSLRSAELGNFSSISPELFLSGNRLTALTLGGHWDAGLSPENFSDLLSCLTSLTHLTLIGEPVDYVRTSNHPVVEIPLLETLVLKPEANISRIYLPTVFRTVRAPMLRELVLDFDNVSSTRELQSLVDKLKHETPPFPSVCHLALRSRSIIHGGWLALAHAFSGIRSLSVSRYITNQLMGFVSCSGKRDAFPNLCTLWFDDVQFEWSLLFQLLQIREAVGLPVREVKMKGFKKHAQSVINGKLLEAYLAAHAAVLIGWT
ncbi:hypothetical protein K503DRAFT_289863 [Rhizopogon vinicolor AM-OR11-026]|uniref:F-box domain-containing protein n=1 Tax=Rhizopogon vinicolor AM-OR11-026 TaxID=1314800 RepID=A0A1B7MVC4_9AGAM|nr:hypothetical protein K503DRAFT_289863 [Rhizopogon vinicolor AM-OR11-026]